MLAIQEVGGSESKSEGLRNEIIMDHLKRKGAVMVESTLGPIAVGAPLAQFGRAHHSYDLVVRL